LTSGSNSLCSPNGLFQQGFSRVWSGRKADGVLHPPFFQRRVEFRLGKSGVGAEDDLLALLLLPLNLGQQQFFPALGTLLAEGEIGAAKVSLSIMIGTDLVYDHRPLLAAMSGEISLPIAIDVESPDQAPALNRFIPDARVHRLAAPVDVAR